MKTPFRRMAAAFVAAFAFALPAAASTNYSADYTDLWYTPSEQGWGVTIAQNGQVLFLVLYVYGGDQLPRWYVASGLTPTTPTNWSGDLYRTLGTSFASPWAPSQSQVVKVGTMTLNFASPTSATMTYTVDGITVTKSISRISLQADNFAGPYFGGLIANTSSCSVTTDGYFIANRLVIDHSVATNPRFTVDIFTRTGQTASCVFQGTYTQQGRMGSIPNGTWQCTGAANNAGTFSMTEMQGTQNGFNAKFSGRDQYCQNITGFFGGLKDVK